MINIFSLPHSVSIKEALLLATQFLEQNSVLEPLASSKRLLLHSTNLLPIDLIRDANILLTEKQKEHFEFYINERAKHKPVSRIIGKREFWGLEFKINEYTLDPRPDTEILIETILKYYPDKNKDYFFLDIGTGSGCIAIALLKEYPNAKAIGLDICEHALNIAKHNSATYCFQNRINFICSDFFNALSVKFDLIVSNPPYIGNSEKQHLSKDVLLYDPYKALFAENNGLEAYSIISAQSSNFLKKNGHIFLENGIRQEKYVEKIFNSHGFLSKGQYKDLNHIIRCLVFSLK
jgi:release factor glutamine methyltransferase